ncbi:PKD domain-containing protein [Haloplanus aerogenes]|nr:PKD domain-containing protein [Haloplanus aerogenes]
MQAFLPTGWQGSITDADGGAPNPTSGTANVLEVIWLTNGTYEVTYDVEVPSDATAGDYTVTTEGSGIDPNTSGQITDTTTTTITVQTAPDNAAPSASFTYSPSDPTTGESVSFDASASSDPDGSIASYEWDFGDGSNATGATPSHTYDSAGTYTVELTVTDNDSETATATQTVTVSEAEPSPDMETSVSIQPASSQTFVGGTTTFDLVVDDANGGVGAYSATVSLDDASIAQISDVDLKGSPAGQTTNVAIAPDGSSVTIDAALMNTADTGSVAIATITVQGGAAGSTGLTPSVSALGNEQGTSYTVAGTSGASLDVTAKSTSVSIQPSSSEITVDQTTTFDLVVDDANGGVGAYTATVSLDDASVAEITDVELQGNPAEQTSQVTIAPDGSSVTIDAALMNTADTGSVTVATITVEGVDDGSADLSTSVAALGDEDGNNYAVTGTTGASLTVTEVVVGNFVNPVSDPDSDSQYEDINGDGNFNIVDVQAMFANLNDDAIQNNPDKFDFNNDGSVNIVDVQALFFELIN